MKKDFSKVYIVGWRDRTFAEIGNIFWHLSDAEAYREKLRETYCRSGGDRDGTFLVERSIVGDNIL